MKKFEFYQDIKVSVWQRQSFTIEAETEEEAKQKALAYQYADAAEIVERNEWLYDTEELIYPEENGGQATIELWRFGEKEPFATNASDEQKQIFKKFDEL